MILGKRPSNLTDDPVIPVLEESDFFVPVNGRENVYYDVPIMMRYKGLRL